jgi:hypothetical protein
MVDVRDVVLMVLKINIDNRRLIAGWIISLSESTKNHRETG